MYEGGFSADRSVLLREERGDVVAAEGAVAVALHRGLCAAESREQKDEAGEMASAKTHLIHFRRSGWSARSYAAWPWTVSQVWMVDVSCGESEGADFWSICMNQSTSAGESG
jgi:hypothetical protein